MAGKGSLILQIYSAHMAIPIKDVSVTVTAATPSAPIVIAHRITDESGLTVPIEFNTPDADLSTSPNNTRGYVRSDIRLSRAGYYDVVIRDVQIFPGVESIQQMEMIPLPENIADRFPRVFTVTPQSL